MKNNMRAFLLDTNIWAYWYNHKGYPKESANIQKQIEELITREQNVGQFVWQPAISVISWGEIDYGYNAMPKKEQAREAEFRKFISGVAPWLVPINRHTAKTYGELRARLFEKYAHRNKRTKGLRPEQLIDPVTSLELGIQENDLWITAQAATFNLTLVSNDKLSRIREIAGDDLHIENWTT
ncbi:MAG: type II toxin-antitoxin system VapC family toxin [Planctomycetota bacterium]